VAPPLQVLKQVILAVLIEVEKEGGAVIVTWIEAVHEF
jgi:hypothetical protein